MHHIGSHWRMYREMVSMSFMAVRVNKLRSFLSVLGISIGIFCVVSVYALVNSLEYSLKNQFNKLGADVVFVEKWPWDDFGNNYPWWTYFKRPVTSMEEAQYLKEKVSSKYASTVAYNFSQNADIQAEGNALKNITIKCVSYDFNEIQTLSMRKGRFFTEEEALSARSVVVIGFNIAQQLFGHSEVLGQKIRVKNMELTVVGVCEYQGTNIIGSSSDDVIYVSDQLGITWGSPQNAGEAQILIKAAPGVELDDLSVEVSRIMRQIRKLQPQDEDNFAVNQMSMITNAVSTLFVQIKKIGLIIGSFALLVGCFGVANIMFVSVKERTREIGIQKALGATHAAISIQFLLESIWLSVIGGILGLVMVQCLMKALSVLGEQQLGKDMVLGLDMENALFGFLISIVVGIVAGFMPARSAARMAPVEAIRAQ